MTDPDDEIWQQRIRDLYSNVEELYSHVDITVVVFDRDLVEVRRTGEHAANPFGQPLADIARRALATAEPQRDIALDSTGRQRVHAIPLHGSSETIGVACVVDDDGARRELFVRCAMAIFDGYRRNEAALLERERRALEEARRANRLRDQFLAKVAHELRSPMGSILLWEQVLRHPSLDTAVRTTALDAIHASASGQAVVVADLLDISRAINGKLRIDRDAVSIRRVLAMAIEDARPHADARGLEIVAQLDDELGDVHGDSRRLRQVFDNLLSNAIKFTQLGTISVRARQDDSAILVEISDTGCGIAPDFLPHIFEPFWQADESDPTAGLGLGLGIALQLVELHGGMLSASSEGVGRGAQFRVSLPRAGTAADVTRTPRPSIAGVRVLVVDNDALLLEALQLLLGRAGAVVSTATSAALARAILQEGKTDIVLSDIGMAGEDGCTFVRRIRATSGPTQRLPAIAITAATTDDSRARAIAAGFDRYSTKPIDIDLLVESIAQLVAG